MGKGRREADIRNGKGKRGGKKGERSEGGIGKTDKVAEGRRTE